jgi:hypothetical protein
VTAGEAGDRLARSQEHVRTALNQWDAVDLKACQSVCLALQSALTELAAVQREIRTAGPANRAALMLRLGWIRGDASRLARLIDASQAYYRGLDLCAGGGDSGPRSLSLELGQA